MPTPGGAGGPGGSPAALPDSYFTESRKGEVNELRNLLRNFATERDQQRKRDILKKVIGYMTIGIDVSRLFTEMMLAIETRDLVIKKMVYLYLCNYANTHPDLAQMCINTLQKDCGNEDPMVRGLALRALCSLNLPQMVEYIGEPLRRSLQDHHAYVRKTGVMGILKLYHLDPESFREANFVDILYDMLKDVDSSVVSNAILVLNEVLAHEKSPNGGMAINRAIMLHLLNRIHEFAEFQILQVLDLVPRYIPANAEEGFQIMNLLDPILRTSSCAAVLSTVRGFLSLADQIGGEDPSEMKHQVVGRVKASLITLMASGNSEMEYCLLKQIKALVELCPGSFDDEYRQFYIRYNEPTHVKYLKVETLALLANPGTAPDIVAELSELVQSNDKDLSRLAIRSLTRIACRNTGGPGCAEAIAQRMVEWLDFYSVDHIPSEAATALTQMVRKHPTLKPMCSISLARTLRYLKESAGKASVIYLLGECGETVAEAPYALEKLIDTYSTIKDVSVKMALLNATMKLFFKRPPEVQRMLGRLLHAATDDVSSQDLHDRALLYYRLLRSGADPKTQIAAVLQTDTTLSAEAEFCEDDDKVLRKELLQEFNSLATIYNRPSIAFVGEKFQVKYKMMPEEHPLEDMGGGANVDNVPAAPTGMSEQAASGAPVPESYGSGAAATPDAVGSGPVADLLGFGGAPAPVPSAAPQPAANGRIALTPPGTMSGEEYQGQWGSIADSEAIVGTVMLSSIPPSTDVVEAALASENVSTMASGELPGEFKFFLYAKDGASGAMLLVQSNISKQDPEPLMILTVKVCGGDGVGNQQKVDQLVAIVQRVLTA